MKNKILTSVLLAAMVLGTVNPVNASDDNNNVKTALRFIGNINNQPVFELQFATPSEVEFTVLIRDEYSNVLYRHNSRGGSFSKKFMLNTEEVGDNNLRFEIIIGKNQKPVVYEVNRYTKTVEEVLVSKLQ